MALRIMDPTFRPSNWHFGYLQRSNGDRSNRSPFDSQSADLIYNRLFRDSRELLNKFALPILELRISPPKATTNPQILVNEGF